ncbi:hypothetical protein [Massilia mucilaginosa]|nr:hypothetical protein [Massilia mucilaginosa]
MRIYIMLPGGAFGVEASLASLVLIATVAAFCVYSQAGRRPGLAPAVK